MSGLDESQGRWQVQARSDGPELLAWNRVACFDGATDTWSPQMNSLVEEPSIRQNLYPISVGTYHTLGELGLVDERVELLRGMIVTKMPKSGLHVYVVRRLLELLSLVARRLGLEILKEDPLSLGIRNRNQTWPWSPSAGSHRSAASASLIGCARRRGGGLQLRTRSGEGGDLCLCGSAGILDRPARGADY